MTLVKNDVYIAFFESKKVIFMKKKYLWMLLFISVSSLYAEKPHKSDNSEAKEKISSVAHRLNLLRSEGLDALDRHNYLGAVEIFKEILLLKPEKWLEEKEYNEILIYLARAQIHTRQFSEAQKHLNSLLNEGLSDVLVYNRDALKAQIHYAKGQSKDAILILHRLIEQFPIQEWDLSDQKFYLKVKAKVDSYYEDLFSQAERCFQGGIYQETIPIYNEILEALKAGVYKPDRTPRLPFDLRMRMAYCLFENENYAKAKDVLLEAKKLYASLFEAESFHQLIVCCRELEEYDEALKLCGEFQTFKYEKDKQEPVLFETARLYYIQKQTAKSKQLLESLVGKLKQPYYDALSRFYLAKILLQERKYTEVEKILHPDRFNFEPESQLKCEWAYLRAEALYHRKQYEMALAGFKESLSHAKVKKMDWYSNALYNLGYCYLKLGEDHLKQTKSKEEFFMQAEETFNKLLDFKKTDQAILALARIYLLKHHYLKDPEAKQNICRLIEETTFEKMESELESGFILADMTSDPKAKAEIYQNLCSERYAKAQNYGKAWFYQAAFQNHIALLDQNEEGIKKAIDSYQLAYEYLKGYSHKLCIACVKNRIGAHLSSKQEGFQEAAYQYLSRFLETEAKDLKAPKAMQELGCLKAEVCLKLLSNGKKEYFQKGMEAISEVMALKEETLDLAYFIKSKLYFQNQDYTRAKEPLRHLIETKPSSNYIADCWFWLAQCNEMEGFDKQRTKEYRQKVYENFPASPLAAEAYFLYYSFGEYLEGDELALKHLENLKENFPTSPYVITSDYLLGLNKKHERKDLDGKILHAKDLSSSITYLSKAKNTFLEFYSKNLIPLSNLNYFTSVYYRCQLSIAQANLEKADECSGAKRQVWLEKAIQAFNEIFADFQNPNSPHAKQLYQEETIPNIYEEACFGRALALGKGGKVQEAEEALSQMIELYAQHKIEKGHYLSRAWYEMAMIAMAKQEYRDALEYYTHSENAMDQPMAGGEQIIELGIQQSLCYRFLGELDMAMLTLSKVINEGIISNLRVKAMVLRAEIYELQGRKELAQKQLEAASEKGGEWGKLATEKLVKEYGVN